MRALDRLISFIFSIIILVVSITLVLVGIKVIEPRVVVDLISNHALNEEIIADNIFNPITITGLVLLILSLKTTVFLSLFKVKSRAPISVKGKNGEVQIAQETIINTARNVALSFDSIKDVQAKMSKKKNGIAIFAYIQVYAGTNIKNLVEAVQLDIKKAIMENIGVNVIDVNVKIKNVYSGKKVEEVNDDEIEVTSDVLSNPVEKEEEEKLEDIVSVPDKKVLTDAIEKMDDIASGSDNEESEEE